MLEEEERSSAADREAGSEDREPRNDERSAQHRAVNGKRRRAIPCPTPRTSAATWASRGPPVRFISGAPPTLAAPGTFQDSAGRARNGCTSRCH